MLSRIDLGPLFITGASLFPFRGCPVMQAKGQQLLSNGLQPLVSIGFLYHACAHCMDLFGLRGINAGTEQDNRQVCAAEEPLSAVTLVTLSMPKGSTAALSP